VELSKNRPHDQEVFVSHANAALTPIARLKLGKLVVDHGFSVSQAADYYRVSWPTAHRWANRYRDELAASNGPVTATAMTDRSSRPHHSPTKTPEPMKRKIVHLRWKKHLGPVQIAGEVDMPASTVYAVLVRCRVNRLSHIDRRTGEPIRRYQRDTPGSLVHVDVKKLGNIPDGGGWRYLGRLQGMRNRYATPGKPINDWRRPKMGHAFVHSVLDDHSRVVYAEVHDDERKETAAAVLRHAAFWFLARGIVIEEVISDNGSCYKSNHWRDSCRDLDIKHRRTRPYRPQTNGKIERFHRTLADGWAFARLYASESSRRNALPRWIHHYNHHRPHTATGNQPPISRLTNLSGQYT
jgi:transposase InsO family protein